MIFSPYQYPSMISSVLFLTPMLFILYLVARWRDNRAQTPDPQLGYKFSLHLFQTISIHIVLASIVLLLSTLLHAIISSDFSKSMTPLRVSIALLVPTIILYFFCVSMLSKTNDSTFTGVARLFNGYNWIITAIIAFGTVIALCQMIAFATDTPREAWSIVVTLFVVYAHASVYFGKRVKKQSLPASTN